jgi:hypothetical protein
MDRFLDTALGIHATAGGDYVRCRSRERAKVFVAEGLRAVSLVCVRVCVFECFARVSVAWLGAFLRLLRVWVIHKHLIHSRRHPVSPSGMPPAGLVKGIAAKTLKMNMHRSERPQTAVSRGSDASWAMTSKVRGCLHGHVCALLEWIRGKGKEGGSRGERGKEGEREGERSNTYIWSRPSTSAVVPSPYPTCQARASGMSGMSDGICIAHRALRACSDRVSPGGNPLLRAT